MYGLFLVPENDQTGAPRVYAARPLAAYLGPVLRPQNARGVNVCFWFSMSKDPKKGGHLLELEVLHNISKPCME
jgi:hypothetical protein